MSTAPFEVTAVVPLFRRLEQWRIENGRDPRTGRRVNPGRQVKRPVRKSEPPMQRCDVDPKQLVLMALRTAAQHTTRNDLRPMYLELARVLEESNEQP